MNYWHQHITTSELSLMSTASVYQEIAFVSEESKNKSILGFPLSQAVKIVWFSYDWLLSQILENKNLLNTINNKR